MSISRLEYDAEQYGDALVSGSTRLRMSHSMVGEKLAIDDLTAAIRTRDLPVRLLTSNQGPNDFIFTQDGKILCIRGGPRVPVFKKNEPGFYYFDDSLIKKFFLKKQRQLTEYKHEQIYYSAIDKLGQSKHYGDLYNGKPAGDVFAEIFGGVIPYTVDSAIAVVPVYGYLPYDWRRENARKLLAYVGGALRDNPDGSVRVTTLSDAVAGTFDKPRVFRGGEVLDEVPVTAVQVTEYHYIETQEEKTIYTDTSVQTDTIYFTEPYHDLHITNGTIIDSGVNYCTFTGAGLVTITGKKYLVITRIVTHGTEPTGSPDDVVAQIRDNTLINPLNAPDMAKRYFDFLSVAKTIRTKVVFGTERPGDVVNVLHPHTKQLVKGCLKSMDIVTGKTELRASSIFLVDYVPPGIAAGFQNYVILTGSGIWTVPEGVTQIRVILIGAGSGGYGGNGGNAAVQSTSGLGANGGAGGKGGTGGYVYEANLSVTPASTFDYECGSGGVGGSGGENGTYSAPTGVTGSAGAAGEDTTFGALSSSSGRLYPDGYYEPKSGLTLGADGDDGISGSRGNHYSTYGGPGPSITFNGITYNPGTSGNDYYVSGIGNALGGCGGGAAVGSDGGNGTNGYSWYGTYQGRTGTWAQHGNGGAGANASIAGANAGATDYGKGGGGGHGGGGGGFVAGDIPNIYDIPGNYSPGGDGSQAGNGGNGGIIIYF